MTLAGNTGAISNSNEKPNLATFPGLSLFFQANDSESQNQSSDVSANKQQKAATQPTAPQNKQAESNNGAANTTAQEPTNEQSNEQVKTNGEQSDKTEDSTQTKPANEKQPVKPDLSTFPGLSMFFTDVKNADAKDNTTKTPSQDTNAGKNEQGQISANGDKTPAATLIPAEKAPAAPKKDAALTAAASDLQSAIDKGNAYVNSDKFNQMTVEKQKQLRDAIQTGKELMAKYNTMQAAMNSAALEVDQNNKNKVETKANTNVTVLTTLNVNNNTTTDTNAGADKAATDTNKTPAIDTTTVTAPELKQAAQGIIQLLGAPGSNIIWDNNSETITITGGEIGGRTGALSWQQYIPSNADVKHIKITGPITVSDGDASYLFGSLQDLRDITGLNYLDTSDVTIMSSMFGFDPSLTSLDLPHFDTSNVTTMSDMFYGDVKLTSLDLSSFDTSNVTSMSYMFSGDSTLTSVNVSSFNTKKVTNMEMMFAGTNLKKLNISNFDTTGYPESTTNMFDSNILDEITLGDNTWLDKFSDIFNPAYDDPEHPTKEVTLPDGKSHPGTWYNYTAGTINLKFVNESTNVQVGTATLKGYTNDAALDFSDEATRATYITIPDGYQYSRMGTNIAIYSYAGTPITVYVTGDPTTNLKINYKLTDGTSVGSPYVPKGHHVDDKLTLDKAFYDANPVAGYSYSSSDPSEITYTANPTDPTKQQTATIYVTADPQNNVTINYINAKNGTSVGDPYKPKGTTGAPIKLKGGIPKGYHYASDDELTGTGYMQPDAATTVYTTGRQTISVYVMGDSVPDDGTNKDAVHVLHYLESQDNKPTTDKVPGIKVNDYWLGGAYGDTVTASGTDEKQKAPDGYTIVNPKKQSYELAKGATKQPEFIFYYKADAEANLSVQYVNARTGKDVGKAVKAPDGYMNKPFDPTDSNSFIKTSIPDGYHYATTTDELNGKTQPKNDGSVKYTDQDYTVPVYVAGDIMSQMMVLIRMQSTYCTIWKIKMVPQRLIWFQI